MTTKKNKVKLTADELKEFKIRRATLDAARCQHLMVEEAYLSWTKAVKEKYNLTSTFDIDTVTGALKERTDG